MLYNKSCNAWTIYQNSIGSRPLDHHWGRGTLPLVSRHKLSFQVNHNKLYCGDKWQFSTMNALQQCELAIFCIVVLNVKLAQWKLLLWQCELGIFCLLVTICNILYSYIVVLNSKLAQWMLLLQQFELAIFCILVTICSILCSSNNLYYGILPPIVGMGKNGCLW